MTFSIKHLLFIVFFSFYCFVSCNNNSGDPTKVFWQFYNTQNVNIEPDAHTKNIGKLIFTKQPVTTCVQTGETAKFSCEVLLDEYDVLYRLFETDAMGTYKVPIGSWTTYNTLETQPFTEKCIKYYIIGAMPLLCNIEGEDPQNISFSDVVAAGCTGLPLLYLDTSIPTADITREAYVLGSMKLLSEEFGSYEYIFSKEKEGIKGRGNSSWRPPIKGYNLKFDKKQSFFNLPKSKKWCIQTNWYDVTLIHNIFSEFLGTEIFNTGYNPTYNYIDVIMNGKYLGNYIFCEKISLDNGRIDIKDISKSESLNDGGFIFEIDFRGDGEYSFYTDRGLLCVLKDPDSVSPEIYDYVKNIINIAENVLYQDNFNEVYNSNGEENSLWMQYFDVDSIVDWYIVNEFAKQLDSPFITSVYVYYNPIDKKLHMGPNWDFDESFGIWYRDINEGMSPLGWYTRQITSTMPFQKVNWISRMFEDYRFVYKVKNRWNDKKTILYNSITNEINNSRDKILISAELNFLLRGNIKPSPTYKESWLHSVDEMVDWCKERYKFIDTELNL